MPSLDEKPTSSIIQQQEQHLRSVWSQTHTFNRKRDSFYNRTYQLWATGVNRPVLRPGKPRAIIDHAVDQLLGSAPTIRRFGETKKEQNDEVEKALQSIFHQVALQEHSLTFKQAAKHLMAYGYTVVEDDLDSRDLALARSDKPTKGESEDADDFNQRERLWRHKKRAVMPFRIRAPHPNSVLLDPAQRIPRVALKVSEWYAQNLVDLTRARKELDRGAVETFTPRNSPWELVKATEYWTETWHALMTGDGQMLVVEPNVWEFVPFSHAFSGFGMEEAGKRFNPKMLAVGLLDHIMDDLLAHAQDLSAKHNLLLEAAFMSMGTSLDPSQVEDALAKGEIVPMQNRGELWYLERPSLPRNIQDVDAQLDKDMEDSTFTRSISGVRDVGVNTVGQQAILNTAGRRKFIDPGEQINQLATASACHILQWIDTLDLRLEIEGHKISRRNVEGDFTAQVSFQVVDPVLRLQEKQQALAELQAGVMSLETFWSIAGREDSTGERERITEDNVYAHPLVQERFAKLAAQRLGLSALLADQSITGGGVSAAPQKTILGPDGQPWSSTMGAGGGPPLRQPLDNQTVKPGLTGQNLAG